MADVSEWLSSGSYLPKPLRDFHDQKQVFKMIGELMARRVSSYKDEHGMEPPEAVVNWVAGHIYVIDLFLWFMAKHGYTLQRVRSRKGSLDFYDLDESIRDFERLRVEFYTQIMPEREEL
jgi:hypothetical protein